MSNGDPLDLVPPQLRVALREFGAWSDAQLLREESLITPVDPLFHYTGEASLEGILKNEHLWCFSHLHQTDKEEFSYSRGIALKELGNLKNIGDQFGRNVCGCLEDLLTANDYREIFEFYLFSLSQRRDSLSQWKDYGRNSGQEGAGFSIGFAPHLFLPDIKTISDIANENIHVGKVTYGDVKTTYRHHKVFEAAAQIANRIGKQNHAVVFRSKEVHFNFARAMALEVLARQLIWRCLTSKRLRFESEAEIRFVMMNVPAKFDGLRNNHCGRTYVKHDLPLRRSGNITEIMIGPAAAGDAEAKVIKLLNKLDYSGVPVTRSQCAML
jgi:hypothetical protein